MRSFFNDLMDFLAQYLKGLMIFSGLLVVILLVIWGAASYKTTDSEFCDNCHYMEPYVRHWQESGHAMVDCVDCHDYTGADLIWSGLKYAVDVYNVRPQTRVPDENCMSSDCHSMEDISDEIQYKNGIFFSHGNHLEKVLRGGKLHCVSCHNQIVQYDDEQVGHMNVNDKSCFVCHFKDAGVGEAITGCNSCHGMPKKEVEHAGFIFDHEPYLKLDVSCDQCHTQIVEGNGAVPEAKCHSCHVERYRTEYTEAELHEIHVTNNAIDCYKCHSDIRHGNFAMVGALDIQCESCHLRQHNVPKQLYMGIGGKDSLDMPSMMFLAQVSCTGCHTHISPEGNMLAHQEKKEASRQSCVTCHGTDYDLMFDNWLSGSKLTLADFQKYLTKANADLNAAGGSRKARVNAQKSLSTARENYNFVKTGHMPHNIQYSVYLLNKSADQFEAAMKQINTSYRGPNRGDGLNKEKNCTVFCHGDAFFPEEVPYDGSDLPHLMHVEDMEISCASCHSTTVHGKTEITQSVCSDCH